MQVSNMSVVREITPEHLQQASEGSFTENSSTESQFQKTTHYLKDTFFSNPSIAGIGLLTFCGAVSPLIAIGLSTGILANQELGIDVTSTVNKVSELWQESDTHKAAITVTGTIAEAYLAMQFSPIVPTLLAATMLGNYFSPPK